MFETYLFSDEWNQEEKDNLIKKTVYYMERTDLPEQVVKPHALVYGDDGKCKGYTYRKPFYDMISMKELFQPDNMNVYSMNQKILFQIAKNVLDLTERLHVLEIYPGLIDLSHLYVPVNQPDKSVLLFHPELFQAGEIAASCHWYPSDEKLFEEEFELFDEEKQRIADWKLIYKILTASAKGNAKIPPNQKHQDHSWMYWSLLSDEWKEYFLNLGHEKINDKNLRHMLCLEIEKDCKTEERVTEEHIQKEKAYALITILRHGDKAIHDISRELYLLQERLENHKSLDFAQGFVLGNKHPYTKEFRHYPKEYRSQLGHVINDYSFGETMIIAAEMMENALKKENRPSILFLLVDGEIRNDKIFHIAIKRLEKMTENWYTKLVLVPTEEFKGEGYQRLKELCMKGNK